jgi:putative ABC transport system substrate-binding protein
VRSRGVALPGSVLSRTRRRDFLAALAGAATWSPPSLATQRAEAVIGYLYAGTLADSPGSAMDAFWRGLAELGYRKGENVHIEFREAQNDLSRLTELTQDLIRRQVSIMVIPGSGQAVRAAMAATSTIPIVFGNAGDPIRLDLVESLNRPGRNATGVTDFGNALSAKRLELAKLLVPTASRFGLLIAGRYAGIEGELANAREGAPLLSVETVESVANTPQEIDAAFAAFAENRAHAVCLIPSGLFLNQRRQIVALAARYRLPTVYPFIEFPQAGGLMSYGTSLSERAYQMGIYAGLILNGANPAELPVRRLSRFELVLNMRTARALDLTVPPRLLAIADRVIE